MWSSDEQPGSNVVSPDGEALSPYLVTEAVKAFNPAFGCPGRLEAVGVCASEMGQNDFLAADFARATGKSKRTAPPPVCRPSTREA